MNNIYYTNTYLQQIQNIALPNKYTKWYCSIINSALVRSSSKKDAKKILGYVEKHHILPKSFSLGGEKDKLNYAFLSGKEHYIAHRLLTKMFSGEFYYKMNRALWYMLKSGKYHSGYRYIPTANVYQQIKMAHAKVQSETKKGKPNHVCSDSTKQYLSKLYTGKTKVELYGEEKAAEIKRKISKKVKGQKLSPRTAAYCAAQSIAKKGKPNSKESKMGMVKANITGVWFKSPMGIDTLFCPVTETAKMYNLNPCNLYNVKAGRTSNHKGWTYSREANKNEISDIIDTFMLTFEKGL